MIKKRLITTLILLFGLSAPAFALFGGGSNSSDELLEPEKAFPASAKALNANTVEVEYNVADGYYLYHKKFKFQSETDGITLGEPQIPTGKVKQDEYFGEVETHRFTIRIKLPIERTASAGNQLQLAATAQGCADMGVCYPPLTQKLSVALAESVETKPAITSTSSVNATAPAAEPADSDEAGDVLDPDVAFVPSIAVNEQGQLAVSVKIADGHYLYKDKFKFSLPEGSPLSLGEPIFTAAEEKDDQFFGKIKVYHHQADITLPILGEGKEIASQVKLRYQGCSESNGICYPPQTKILPINLSATPVASTSSVNAVDPAAEPVEAKTTQAKPTSASTGPANGAPLSEQDQIAQSLSTGGFWTTVVAFFVAGLLLALTPCVFPMIPILSSIIVGQGHKVTTRHAFTLSLIYVLAMAATYTIVGILVGISGENIQAWFQNPWVLSIFSAIFIALSFSMFGFYELQMPSSIQSRLTEFSNKQEGGTYLGVAIMGFLSALIVGPCVTAPLVGALIYIADTGDALLGGVALFALSMGMGAPLIAIGTSAGKLLPRAGGWMDSVKAVFGVMILGMAIWMLDRILPLAITMALWALLLIGSAIYMGALEPIKEGTSGWNKLWKGLGVALLIYGTLMMIGAAAGGTSLLSPLKGVGGGSVVMAGGTAASQATGEHMQFRRIKGVDGLNQALAEAKANNQTVMLDFYADWCVSCKEMESFTFSDANVQATLQNSLKLQADVTDNDEADKALLKHFGLFGPPAIMFFDANSQEQRNYRVVGFMEAEKFTAQVKAALRL